MPTQVQYYDPVKGGLVSQTPPAPLAPRPVDGGYVDSEGVNHPPNVSTTPAVISSYASLRAKADEAERAGASREQVLKMRDLARDARIQEALRAQAQYKAGKEIRQSSSLALAKENLSKEKFEKDYVPGTTPTPIRTVVNTKTGVEYSGRTELLGGQKFFVGVAPVLQTTVVKTASVSQVLNQTPPLTPIEKANQAQLLVGPGGKLVNPRAYKNAGDLMVALGYHAPVQVGQLNLERQERLFTLKGPGLLPELSIKGRGMEAAGTINVYQKTITAENQAEARFAGLPGPGTYVLTGASGTYTPIKSTITTKLEEANKNVAANIKQAGTSSRSMSLYSLSKEGEQLGQKIQASSLRLQNMNARYFTQPEGLAKTPLEKLQVASTGLLKFSEASGGFVEQASKDVRERPVEFATIYGTGVLFKGTETALVAAESSNLLKAGEASTALGRLGEAAKTTTRVGLTTTRVGGEIALGGAFIGSTAVQVYGTGGEPVALGKLGARTTEDVFAFTKGFKAFEKPLPPQTTGPLKDFTFKETTYRYGQSTSTGIGATRLPEVKPLDVGLLSLEGKSGTEAQAQLLAASMQLGNRRVASPESVVSPGVRTLTTTRYTEGFKLSEGPGVFPSLVDTTVTQYPSGLLRKVQTSGDLKIVTVQKPGQIASESLVKVYQEGELLKTYNAPSRFKLVFEKNPSSTPFLSVTKKEGLPEKPFISITTTPSPKGKPLLEYARIKTEESTTPFVRLTTVREAETTPFLRLKNIQGTPEPPLLKLNLRTDVFQRGREMRPLDVASFKTKGSGAPLTVDVNVLHETPATGKTFTLRMNKAPPVSDSLTYVGGKYPAPRTTQLDVNLLSQASMSERQFIETKKVGGREFLGFRQEKSEALSLTGASDATVKQFGRVVQGQRIVRSATGPKEYARTKLEVVSEEERLKNEFALSKGKTLTKENRLTQVADQNIVVGPRSAKVETRVTGLTAKRSVASALRERTSTLTVFERSNRAPQFSLVLPKKEAAIDTSVVVSERYSKAGRAFLERRGESLTGEVSRQKVELASPEVKTEGVALASVKVQNVRSQPMARASRVPELYTKGAQPSVVPVTIYSQNKTRTFQPVPSTSKVSFAHRPPRNEVVSSGGLLGKVKTKKDINVYNLVVAGNTATSTRQDTSLTSQTKQNNILVPAQAQNQETTLKLQQQQRQEPQRLFRLPRPEEKRFYAKEKKKEPPPLLPGGTPRFGGLNEGGYNVLVRRKGKFKKINTMPLSATEALKLGEQKVSSTLAASFKVVTPQGRSVEPRSALGFLGKAYTTGKKDTTLFVQQPRFRLGTRTERTEIQQQKSRRGFHL